MKKRIFALLMVVVLAAGALAVNAMAETNQEPLRILTIGNSHSEDSTWQLARVFAAQDPDREVIVGTMYFSSCKIEQHVDHAYNEKPVYSYHKNVDGVWTTTEATAISTALEDEPWDVVVLQEMSTDSGRSAAFQNRNLQRLMDYVDSKLENEYVFYWNMTWASPTDPSFWATGFDPQPPEGWIEQYENLFGTDQIYMYEQIAQNVQDYIETNDRIQEVFPSGTAIQYANHALGQTDEDLYRDYIHMSDLGRLMVAYLWYAKLTGEPIESVNVDVIPAAERCTWRQQDLGDFTVTDEMKQVIKAAVNYTLEHPYTVEDPSVEDVRCAQCRQEVEWTPWDGATVPDQGEHYYLTQDVTLDQQITLPADFAVTLNLNGKTLTANSRAFQVSAGATLSIMDSVGTGKIQAAGVAGENGGVFLVDADGTLNIHSGTFTNTETTNGIDTGGVAYIAGTMNMRGGQIIDGNADRVVDNVYVSYRGTLNMSGGEIGGQSDYDVYLRGAAQIGGKARISNLRIAPYPSMGGPAVGDMLTISGQFHGLLGITVYDAQMVDDGADIELLAAGLDIGNSVGADFADENVFLRTGTNLGITVQNAYDENGDKVGENLVVAEMTYCDHCKKNVTWKPLNESHQKVNTLNRGHYYADFAAATYPMTERTVPSGHKVCLDLKGKSWQGTYRAFYLEPGAELSILGSGMVLGRGTDAYGDGGVIYVTRNATLNLYEATLRSELGTLATRGASNGGVVAVDGTFNMFGGRVNGKTRYSGENTNTAATGNGGAVYISNLGTMNMSAGLVTTVADEDCLYTEGELVLSGSAKVDNVTLAPVDGGAALGDLLTVKGAYTGTAQLTVEAELGTDIGNSQDAQMAAEALSIAGKELVAAVQGTDLVAAELLQCAHCGEKAPFVALTEDWADAETLPAGHYYLAFQGDSLEIREKAVTGKVCLDLRGKTLAGQTRAFSVNAEASLAIIGEGSITGSGIATPSGEGSSTYGGTIFVAKDATVDLYEATLTYTQKEGLSITHGGVVSCSGTFNMHGGTISGGIATYAAGNFYLSGYGTLNMTGGSMHSGTAEVGGPCAYIRGAISLSGDAYIEQIRMMADTAGGGPALSEMLTITGPYNQDTTIVLTEDAVDMDLGTSVNADLTGARIVSSNSGMLLTVSGTDLILAEGTVCPYCDEKVIWKDVDASFADLQTLTKGHYRLNFDGAALEMVNKTIASGETVCIDLNGKSLVSNTRAFTLTEGASLAIIGAGTVTGSYMPGSTENGGAIYAPANSTFTLYEATLQVQSAADQSVANGGVVYTDGVFYMRGGQILGGNAENAGGALYLGASSVLNMTGGSVTGGTATNGACAYSKGKINLSGAATISSVQLQPDEGTAVGDMVTISGNYTGAVNLQMESVTTGTDVGNGVNADLADANVTARQIGTAEPDYVVVPYNADLVIAEVRWCEQCKENVPWTPLTEANANQRTLKDGHYYLAFAGESCTFSDKYIRTDAKVCLDLNGKNIVGENRAFYVNSGATLTLLGEGMVTGSGTPLSDVDGEQKYGYGGIVYVDEDATFNLYKATLTFVDKYPDLGVENGGVLCVWGTCNMYGGQIVGGHANNAGGSVYVGYPGGVFNMSGGSIAGGTSNASSFCMVNRGKITLSGDASIEDLHLLPRGGEGCVTLDEMLTIQGAYTGTVCLRLNEPKAGLDIGTNDNANLSNANISIFRRTLKLVVHENDLELTAEALCPHCQEEFVWQPVTASYADAGTLSEGHYYLAFDEDSYVFDSIAIQAGNMVCFDLGGKDLIGSTRAFTVEGGATLNLMGEGTLAGRGTTDNGAGGTVNVAENGKLNLYNVILTYDDSVQEQGVGNGGVIATDGTVNMYDGQISGGKSENGTNLYVGSNGVFNMTAGTVSTEESAQKEIVDGKLTLSGDASISKVYLSDAADGLTISGAYTGQLAVQYQNPVDGMDAGNSDNADLPDADIQIVDYAGATLEVVGTDLKVAAKKLAAIRNAQGVIEEYEWLADAVAAYTDSTTWIVMLGDTEETVQINKAVNLDLHGFDITGTISGSGTVYVMDSQTDDFTVRDTHGYGTISGTITVDVQALPEESPVAEYGYLKIVEGEKLSFHCICLKVKKVYIRPSVAGIYFESVFNGDELVADQVSYFGVALRVYEEPDETTLQNQLHYTAFDKALFGSSESLTSTLLSGILKTDNTFSANRRNFTTPVYGRAYVALKDGTILFGASGNRTLREVLEGADAIWNTLDNAQISGLVKMYETYTFFLRSAKMPNLDAHIAELENQ